MNIKGVSFKSGYELAHLLEPGWLMVSEIVAMAVETVSWQTYWSGLQSDGVRKRYVRFAEENEAGANDPFVSWCIA